MSATDGPTRGIEVIDTKDPLKIFLYIYDS